MWSYQLQSRRMVDQYKIASIFKVSPADYNIEIPNTVRDNIAKEIKVTVSAVIVPLKK